MTDIVERLRRTLLDRDNFPRMDSEKWLPVGLAKEAADEIERLREYDAALVRNLMDKRPYKDKPWSRMALAVAASAILRGRHLTEAERDENLAKAFDEEGDHEIATKIRAAYRKST